MQQFVSTLPSVQIPSDAFLHRFISLSDELLKKKNTTTNYEHLLNTCTKYKFYLRSIYLCMYLVYIKKKHTFVQMEYASIHIATLASNSAGLTVLLYVAFLFVIIDI